jgi:hypothetical protein
MLMPYFIPVVDDEGNTTYEEVPEKDVQVSDDHPLAVAAEKRKEDTAKFRRLFQEEKAQREALEAARNIDLNDDNVDDVAPVDEPVTTAENTPVEIDTDSLYAQFAERFKADLQTEAETKEARIKRVKAVAKEYRVPSNLMGVLELVADDEARLKETAEALSTADLVFEDSATGALDMTENIMDNIMKDLGIDD